MRLALGLGWDPASGCLEYSPLFWGSIPGQVRVHIFPYQKRHTTTAT
jgi:hypothetical protein